MPKAPSSSARVNLRISDIKRSFAMQIVYHAFILVCAILTNLRPNLTSMIGTIGLGGFGVKANYSEAQNAWQKYQKDQRLLKDMVFVLKLKLDMAGDDPDRLKELENLLLEVANS